MAQIWANFRNGSTGQLSAVTILLMFAGSAARIFTSIQETGDQMMVLQYVISTVTNATLVFQILYYWNVATPPRAGGDARKKRQKKRD